MSNNHVTAERIKSVREIGGLSLQEAKVALSACQGDVLLAVGYAQSMPLAVKIGDGSDKARQRWLMKRAEAFKETHMGRVPN